ncbi:MAG: TIM barrel protein [Methanoculleaceae archaeon]
MRQDHPGDGRTGSYRIGAGCLSTDHVAIRALDGLGHGGVLDHIQVLLVPEERDGLERTLSLLEGIGTPIVIHAPHHSWGVNPCDPEEHIAYAMEACFEAADRTGAPVIVLHPGRFEAGRREEAVENLREFLSVWSDPRIVLENLPTVYGDLRFIGDTPGELASLAPPGTTGGICLDFAHLHCTANYLGIPYPDAVAAFDTLPVRLFHLSASEPGAVTDRHLLLDDPRGGMDWGTIMACIARTPGVEVTLEFKGVGPAVYPGQVSVFDRLYRRYVK